MTTGCVVLCLQVVGADDHPAIFTSTAAQAWDVARAKGYKPVDTPWPQRKGDSTTTYKSQYPAKEVALSRSSAYCEIRSKKLDKNDYGTQCQATYKV